MGSVNGFKMRFTERLFRAFAAMSFLAYLAKSNLSCTFLKMVRSAASTPWYSVATHQYLPSILTFIHVHVLVLSNPHTLGARTSVLGGYMSSTSQVHSEFSLPVSLQFPWPGEWSVHSQCPRSCDCDVPIR